MVTPLIVSKSPGC